MWWRSRGGGGRLNKFIRFRHAQDLRGLVLELHQDSLAVRPACWHVAPVAEHEADVSCEFTLRRVRLFPELEPFLC